MVWQRYRRVASPGACSFCLMLATRGAAFMSQDTAVAGHDHCNCSAELEADPADATAIKIDPADANRLISKRIGGTDYTYDLGRYRIKAPPAQPPIKAVPKARATRARTAADLASDEALQALRDKLKLTGPGPRPVDTAQNTWGAKNRPAPNVNLPVDGSEAQRLADRFAEMLGKYDLPPGRIAEGYRSVLADRLREPVRVMVSQDSLYKVIRDKRFKTCFEVKGGMGKGSRAYLEARGRLEHNMMGLADDLDPKQRPVYGFLDSNTENVSGWGYGNIEVVLKEEARDRATFTVGDSLNHHARPAGVTDVDEMTDLDWFAATGGSTEFWVDTNLHALRSGALGQLEDPVVMAHPAACGCLGFGSAGYIEVQVHGGVRAADIARVIFDEVPEWRVRNGLNKAGIEWGVKGARGDIVPGPEWEARRARTEAMKAKGKTA